MNFPIIADPDRKVANLYDMIHPNADDTLTVRSVYIIGPDKKIRLSMTYPMSIGRNFAEILRALDAVQKTDGVPLFIEEIERVESGVPPPVELPSEAQLPSAIRLPLRST